jgi:hypothetical protein
MKNNLFYVVLILLSLSALSKSCRSTPESESLIDNSNIVTIEKKIFEPIKNPCPMLGSLEKEKYEGSITVSHKNYNSYSASVVGKDGAVAEIDENFAFDALNLPVEFKSEFLDTYSRLCSKDTKQYQLYEKYFLALEKKIKDTYTVCVDKFTEPALIEFQIYNATSHRSGEDKKSIFLDKLCRVSFNHREACEEDTEACLNLIPKYNELTSKYSPIFSLATIELWSLGRSKEDFGVYDDNENSSNSDTQTKLTLYQNKCTKQFGKRFMDYATLNVSELVNLFYDYPHTQDAGHNGFTLISPQFKHIDVEELLCQKSLGTTSYNDCSFDVKTCALVSIKTFEIKNKYDKIKK